MQRESAGFDVLTGNRAIWGMGITHERALALMPSASSTARLKAALDAIRLALQRLRLVIVQSRIT